MPAFNEIGWFEIGTEDPAAAQRFYGEVFGWSFAPAENVGPDYTYVMGEAGPKGGVSRRGDLGYAIFTIVVEDVAKTLEQARQAGGSAEGEVQATPNGLTFGYLRDPAGNLVGLFSPPPG